MAYHTSQCFDVRKLSDSRTVFHAPKTWARLFKTNDVVSYRFVKFSEVDFTNMPIFFVEKKCKKLLQCKKLLSFFQQKISVYWVIKP